jgi:general secretion pathway protein J
MQRADGFTLVELLLAVALSVVIAALGYAGVNSGMEAATALENEVHELTELQRALNIIEEDLVQVRLRPVVHGVDYHEPAFVSGDNALLEFTRGGVANPLHLQRSELQRVRYVLRDGALWRQYWLQLDRVDALQPPQQVLLLSGVSNLALEFLSPPSSTSPLPDVVSLQESGANWQQYWNSDDPRNALTTPLPLAVRLTVTTAAFAQVQRVYELP